MKALVDFLVCPGCGESLSIGLECCVCGVCYPAPNGIPQLRLVTDPTSETVRLFYEEAPFPGYPPHINFATLKAGAERSDFIRRLDREIPTDARILELGCGTGQTSLFLARADRTVIGADLTRASLVLAAEAARRFGIEGVHFVETDIQRPGLRPASFDVVYCSGVLHHTRDPRACFRQVARLVRPGGLILIGVYNLVARIPLRLRRLIARASRYRLIPFDPVLRERSTTPERRRAWLRDQYQHPEEHSHTLGEVQRWFAENDIAYLRSYPSALLGSDDGSLLAPAADNWQLEGWLAQLGWIAKLGHEGGLFVIVGRRADLRRDEPDPRGMS